MRAREWSQAIVVGSLLLCGAGAEAIARTYTTSFPATENSIFEGGNWINGKTTGVDWSDVQTTPGKAYGTESGSKGNFDDSTARLTGSWGPTQTVQAVVYISATDSSTYKNCASEGNAKLPDRVCLEKRIERMEVCENAQA